MIVRTDSPGTDYQMPPGDPLERAGAVRLDPVGADGCARTWEWIVKRLCSSSSRCVAACGEDPKTAVEKLAGSGDVHGVPPEALRSSGRRSMHAYAADDPVFVAMNKRGQRETNGALGTFCVQCHAPMAVALGTITDDNAKDFDLADAAASRRAASPATSATTSSRSSDDHNNGLVLAIDQTMRGGAKNPVELAGARQRSTIR